MKNKYVVYGEWHYAGDESEGFENCIIHPATKESEEYNGMNVIGRGGDEGFTFDIYETLEDAIKNSGFNPESIKFENLSIQDLEMKDLILNKYNWNNETGLIKK